MSDRCHMRPGALTYDSLKPHIILFLCWVLQQRDLADNISKHPCFLTGALIPYVDPHHHIWHVISKTSTSISRCRSRYHLWNFKSPFVLRLGCLRLTEILNCTSSLLLSQCWAKKPVGRVLTLNWHLLAKLWQSKMLKSFNLISLSGHSWHERSWTSLGLGVASYFCHGWEDIWVLSAWLTVCVNQHPCAWINFINIAVISVLLLISLGLIVASCGSGYIVKIPIYEQQTR